MNIGWLLALVVLILCIFALFFSQSMPAWGVAALIAALALAILCTPFSVKAPWQA